MLKRLILPAGSVALLAACDDSLLGSNGTTDQPGWCGVQATLDADCTSCHSPAGGSQGGLDLATDPYGALVNAQSATYAGRTLVVPGDPAASFLIAKLTGAQTGSEGATMPLGGPLPQSTIDVITQWIADGAPEECTADTALATCDTTNESCRPGTCGGEGSRMLPGADCLACHKSGGGEAPIWTAAGTAYVDAAGSGPLDGATIHITDQTHTFDLITNSVGNFHTNTHITPPFTASIETDAGTLTMTEHQTTGACNSCHSCDGAAGGKLHGL
jgi:hypothetical protein